jgi:hypothetical protein
MNSLNNLEVISYNLSLLILGQTNNSIFENWSNACQLRTISIEHKPAS